MENVILETKERRLQIPEDLVVVRVRVWDRPIRFFHWINAISVATLFVTGIYIATPVLGPTGEPYDKFVMGTMRQIHFATAFVFTINLLWRVYWSFFGNEFSRSGLPYFWRKDWWRAVGHQVSDYLRHDYSNVHLGHNPLAGLSYFVFVLGLGALQIVTGFALYGDSNPGGFFDSLFGWSVPLLGGAFRTHMWHHLFAWGFVWFAIAHLYIVFLDDAEYRNSLISSMFSGFKVEKPAGERPSSAGNGKGGRRPDTGRRPRKRPVHV